LKSISSATTTATMATKTARIVYSRRRKAIAPCWISRPVERTSEMVVAQELARDIGRAFDDDARDDAAALARELTASAEEVRALLAELPEWAEAAAFQEAAVEMLRQDDRLVTYWLRHIEEGRRQALQNARNVEEILRDEAIPAARSELRVLGGFGVSCPGQELRLETP
jgi:ribosomal protein S7